MDDKNLPKERDGPQVFESQVTVPYDEDEITQENWGARYTLALLGFLGLSVAYSMRVNLSIAIVAMVGTNEGEAHLNFSEDACPTKGFQASEGGSIVEGEFPWDEQTQGLILGSFFYGYACTNLLGGRAAEYLGGRLVFGLGTVMSSVIALLTPLCARTSTELFIASRILTGAAQGVTVPAIFSLMATWFPPEERAKFGFFIKGGMQFGTVITLTLCGWLTGSELFGSWPFTFYVFGVLGLIWGVPWFLLIHDRPEQHPWISSAELHYIQSNRNAVKKAEVVAVPWKSMAVSPPVWACIVIAAGSSFGFQTLLSEMPTYLANIQHFNMKRSGLMSALPYLSMWIFGVSWGLIMNRLSAAGVLSITAVRRLSTGIAHYVPAVGLIVMCFVDCNSTLAMVILCMAVGASGSTYSGNSLAEQDIAPNLTGTLMGITNTMASVMGIVAPTLTGAITQGRKGSLGAWRMVFLVSAINYVVTTTIYMVTMSTKVQPWNNSQEVKESKESPSSLPPEELSLVP